MARLYRFNDIQIDLQSFRLLRGGRIIPVEPKALNALVFLVENRGRLVQRQELLSAVWSSAFVSDHVLNRAIGQLRKALEDDAKEPRYIETVPTLGYRFIAQVEELGAPGAVPDPEISAQRAPKPNTPRPDPGRAASLADTRASRISRPAFRGLLRPIFIIPSLLLILVLAVTAWRVRTANHSGLEVRSLMVLPLKNLSGDPSQEYVSDGITEEIITELGQIGSLRVISPLTSMQFKDAHKSMPQVASELNVEVVVTGAVIRFGDRIRIDTQLIDAQADHQLWSHSFEGDFRDTFSLQSQVADSIAEQLKRTLNNRAQRADMPPVDKPAYEALLKGIVAEDNTPESEARALEFFKKAVAIDPNLARAYAGIARANDFLAGYGTPAANVVAEADAAVGKAIELDPNLSEAYDERGWIAMDDHWDFPGALRDFQHALELDPNSSDARNGYADVLVINGSTDQGLREMARTRDIDPKSPLVETNDCYLLKLTGHLNEALPHCNAALSLDPTYRWAHLVAGELYGELGDFEKAHENMKSVHWCDTALCQDAFDEVHGAPGKRGAFDKWVRQNPKLPEPFFRTFDYTRLGRFNQAFASMERAYETRDDMDLMIFLGVDSSLDPLHSDPRFDAFLRKVGLPLRPNP